jgi:choline dehydrogenase-like flavoprotein
MATRRYKTSETVDFAVIGAGAAGGIMAKELATAGFSVVVFEQGPYHQPSDFRHDELAVLHRGSLINDHRKQPNTFRRTESDKAVVKPAVEYGRMVGGGSVHFTANYWRFHELDFEERDRYGSIAGTGFDNWPIRYSDLEPYYTQVEYDLGISGLAGANPFEGPRSKPYPLPPMPVKSSGVLFERAAKKLGLHPYPAPVAVLSQPYRGRAACLHCGFCEAFGCEVNAKSSTLASVIPEAGKTGRCEIRPLSYVRKIGTGADGRVNAVLYFDRNGREQRQRVRAVVVCANGAETPRLLLLSKSNLYPHGLANSSGLVGKYLMFDNGTYAMGLFDKPCNEYKSIVVTRVLHDFYAADPKRGFYGGGGLDSRFDYQPIQFALSGTPKDLPRWGSGFKQVLREYYTHTAGVLSHTTCLPLESNSISLDPDVKDAWGLPALRVTFKNHPDDLSTMRFLDQKMRAILEAAGAKKIWSDPDTVTDTEYSRHLMGTCRMGTDPGRSVVNAQNRAHDVPNLFIVDGSSFVTSGRQQPTETIQALSARAADLMIQAARRGELGMPVSKPSASRTG